MKMRRMAVMGLLSFLLIGPSAGRAQPVEQELEEAKALYREAKFAQAIAKLQATIGRLEQLRDIQARKIQLSDAHLHLALSYVALNDPAAAKESLKQMLRANRNRRLDPDVYAPKVIELFEEARKEVAVEPVAATTAPPLATARKGGSKTPLILLGAAAAAGGGIAVAKGGGGGGGTAAAAPAPSATPAPAIPGPPGRGDVVFLGSSPPPGGTLSVSRRDVLTIMLSVIMDRDERDVIVRVNFSEGPGGPCIPNPASDSAPFSLTAGQARTVTVSIPASAWQEQLAHCTLPVSVRPVVYVQHGTCGTAPCIVKGDTSSWTFVK